MRAEYLLLGEILRPQGIKGEVKIKHYADDAQRFLELEKVYFLRGKSYEAVNVLDARCQKDDVFLLLEGVNDRNEAEKLRGQKLYIDRENAAPLDEDTVFIADILGCQVVDEKGESVGTLDDVFPAGGADVYRVKTPEGMMMFPALGKVIASIDADKGVVTVLRSELEEVAVYEDRDTDHLS